MFKSSISAALAVWVLAATAPQVRAEVVSYSFTGHVVSSYLAGGQTIQANYNPAFTPLSWVGQAISGSIWMETGGIAAHTPSGRPVNQVSAVGSNSPAWLRIDVTNPDGSRFSTAFDDALPASTSAILSILDDETSAAGPLDLFSVQINSQRPYPNTRIRRFASIELQAQTAGSYSSLLQGGVWPGQVRIDPLAAGWSRYGQISYANNNDGISDRYQYYFSIDTLAQTTPVPEPATAWLALLGMAGLISHSAPLPRRPHACSTRPRRTPPCGGPPGRPASAQAA